MEAQRQKEYKGSSRFKPEEVRRRRENAQVEIRKQKKEENLAKRRNFNAQTFGDDSDDELASMNQDAQVKYSYLKIYLSRSSQEEEERLNSTTF